MAKAKTSFWQRLKEWWKIQMRKSPVALIALLVSVVAAFGTVSTFGVHATNLYRSLVRDAEDALTQRALNVIYHLQEAERNACAANSSANGSHTFKISLESAANIELTCRDQCPPFVYHALADMGTGTWDFERIEEYCKVAISKSTSVFDRQLSLQQLACAHFDFYENASVEKASLIKAREYFEQAIECLRKAKQERRAIKSLGQAYELWAAHEMYHGHAKSAEECAELAKREWRKLPERESRELTQSMQSHIDGCRQGIHPRSPCRSITVSNAGSEGSNIAPVSKDKSLGKIIDGKLHLTYMEGVPQVSFHTLVDESGKSNVYADTYYTYVYKELIFANPESDIPLKRYVPYLANEGEPTLAPPLAEQSPFPESGEGTTK